MIIQAPFLNFNNPNFFKAAKNTRQNAAVQVPFAQNPQVYTGNIDFRGYLQTFPQLSFRGASSNLKKMYAAAPDGTKYSLDKTQDGSYLVDPETVTRVYYGKDAEKYLNKREKFDLKTQIICPIDGELLIKDLSNGKEIPLKSNGAVVIDEGKEASVKVIKGNPLVVTSERKPVWYEEYCNNPKNKAHLETFKHLNETYQHFYKGHIKITDIGEEVAHKLVEADKADFVDNRFIEMKHYFNTQYMEKDVKDVLEPEELTMFSFHYKKAYELNLVSKEVRKTHYDKLNPKLKEKMLEKGLVYDLSSRGDNRLYWCEVFGTEEELRHALENMKFSVKEQEEIIKYWNKINKTGMDFTGLEYLTDGLSVYKLDKRVNNITGGSQHWDTTSFIVSSTQEDAKTPYISVSEKHADKDYKEPTLYRKIRNAENLHSHPAEINLHQTEIYIITEGVGALTVIENNVPKTIVLKQGEGIVLQPGVKHCVSAFKGKYEHLCCQVPCLFQYGVGVSKIDCPYPEGYSENTAFAKAINKLEKVEI